MSQSPAVPANPGPIVGASHLSYQDCIATTPNMRETVLGAVRPITLGHVTTAIDDTGQAEEITREVRTAGAIQPMQPRELKIYAEGERAWGWYVLYLTSDILMAADDKVVYKGVTYRVMAKMDYSDFGYARYAILQAFQT